MKPSSRLRMLCLKQLHPWPWTWPMCETPRQAGRTCWFCTGFVNKTFNYSCLIHVLQTDFFFWLGLPGQSGGSTDDQKRPTPTAPVLPQVQKNEKASQVILKYLDGITKRIGKISDPWLKYHHLNSHTWFKMTLSPSFVSLLWSSIKTTNLL